MNQDTFQDWTRVVALVAGVGYIAYKYILAPKIRKNRKPRTVTYKETRLVIDDKYIDTLLKDSKKDPFDIVNPLRWSNDLYQQSNNKLYLETLNKFSPGQRQLFAIIRYIAEVNNGGHDQFYFNSTGIVWKDTLAGFIRFGLPDYAGIIEKSSKRFKTPPSLDRTVRQEQLDTDKPDFEDLDNDLYKLESPDKKVLTYIDKHRKEFYFDGTVQVPQF